MSWTDLDEDGWGGRYGVVQLGVRLVGTVAFGYVLWTVGAFTGPTWVAVGTVLALLLLVAQQLVRVWRPVGPAVLVVTVAMMALGVALNPAIDYLGTVFFVVGGIALLGRPEVPARLGGSIVAVLSVGLVLRGVLAHPEWSVLLSNLLGVAAVALFGANRRQRLLRQREAVRVTALEERSRIARDLHDVLAHSLGGLVVQLDAASAELESGRTAEAATRIRASRQLAVAGLREAREAVAQLRSAAEPSDQRGPIDLVDPVRAMLRGPVGLQLGADLDVVGEPRPVRADVVEAITAVAREGLTNIAKYARGEPVAVTLLFAPQAVRLEVVNGLPVAADSDELARSGGGAGLPGLRERLAAVGGRLESGSEGRRWVLAAECPTDGVAGARR